MNMMSFGKLEMRVKNILLLNEYIVTAMAAPSVNLHKQNPTANNIYLAIDILFV